MDHFPNFRGENKTYLKPPPSETLKRLFQFASSFTHAGPNRHAALPDQPRRAEKKRRFPVEAQKVLSRTAVLQSDDLIVP